jgi:hypothetical protein
MIDGAPQVHPFASNPDYHLVEVPSVARAWAAPPQLSCDPGPEFQHPAPHRLIGNLQAALGEKFLNVAVAQCEPEIKPDRVFDDRRREAVPAIGGVDPWRQRTLPGDPFELRFRDNAAFFVNFIGDIANEDADYGDRCCARARHRRLAGGPHANATLDGDATAKHNV